MSGFMGNNGMGTGSGYYSGQQNCGGRSLVTVVPKKEFSFNCVKLVEKPSRLDGELGDNITYECSFCGKSVTIHHDMRRACERMSGTQHFYCPFCIRHGLHTRNSRNFLALSFKGITNYCFDKYQNWGQKTEYFDAIWESIDTHIRVGLQNPAFIYDRDTMMWYIDFSKVGKGKKKVKIKDVLKTVINMLLCFNLDEHVITVRMSKLYQKYEEAIYKFYRNRYRPLDKPKLIPTMTGCGAVTYNTGMTWRD